MVLTLKDMCLSSIAYDFDSIPNLSTSCLSSSNKESIVQRLTSHNILEIPGHKLPAISRNDVKLELENLNLGYQHCIISNFFNGNFISLNFCSCQQLNDQFLHLLNQINCFKNSEFRFSSLYIKNCPNLTDDGLSFFLLEHAKNLEKLKLLGFSIFLDKTLTKSVQSLKLQHLDLSDCVLLNDEALWCVCKNNPLIKSIKLTRCNQITNEGVRASLHMLKGIESLDIEGIKDSGTGFFMDDKEPNLNIKRTSIIIKHLKRLTFSGSNEFYDSWTMKKLFQACSNLIELNVLFSNSKANILSLFNLSLPGKNNNRLNSPIIYMPKSLEVLSIYKPNIKDSRLLIDSLSNLKNLEQLSLNCVDCLDDKTLITLIENIGNQLTKLSLKGYITCPNRITDESLRYISKFCHNLNTICFDLFSQTETLSSLQSIFDRPEYALKYETISLSVCRNLNSNLLNKISINCHNLKNLDLSGLDQLVDDSTIKNVSLNLIKIECLDIKGCKNVTDESICLLATRCNKLKMLDLAGICMLTDKSIFTMANYLNATLQKIYLSGCTKISSVAVRYLSDCCINYLHYEHHVPNSDPNLLMAKNLDTGDFERVDLL